MKRLVSRFHSRSLKDLDGLTPLENQTRRDSWHAVKDLVYGYLEKTKGRFSLGETLKEYATVKRVKDQGAVEIREALNELATLENDGIFTVDADRLQEVSAPSSAAGGAVP